VAAAAAAAFLFFHPPTISHRLLCPNRQQNLEMLRTSKWNNICTV